MGIIFVMFIMHVGGIYMLGNDKTIFKYLEPINNNLFSLMNKSDIYELLIMLEGYYLEYRNTLGISKSDTFGIEIEFEYFDGYDKRLFTDFYYILTSAIANEKWDSRNDMSLVKGREIVSDVLIDDVKCWKTVQNVCTFSSCHGKIDKNCAAHVHVGSQILGEHPIYWYRFFRLWSIYENIINRFCYGEYLSYRAKIIKYARPAASFLEERLKLLDKDLNYSVLDMFRILDGNGGREKYTKHMGISFWRMLADDNYNIYEDFNKFQNGCTLELRVPNGTFDEVIWQNYINFFIKMLYYCKSDKFDEDILNKRKLLVIDNFSNLAAYSNIYMDQVMEFVDMIFDNNLDKIYFLKQYLKSMEISDKPLVKARKMTDTKI